MYADRDAESEVTNLVMSSRMSCWCDMMSYADEPVMGAYWGSVTICCATHIILPH